MSISASEQGLGIPRSNLPFPFQKIGAVPVPVPEKYARTSGKYFGDGKGTSTDAMGIAEAIDQGTQIATAGDN